MNCEECQYSKNDYTFNREHKLINRALFCYVQPPSLDDDTRTKINVTDRPAPCFRYKDKAALEKFEDLLPVLELMIPQQNLAKTPAHLNEANEMAYKHFLLFRDRGYKLTPIILDYMAALESCNPIGIPNG